MTVARALGILGKTVIALGVSVLLFAFFQLWGTGLFEARAQQNLDSEFADLLEESGALGPAPLEPGPAATPATRATPEPTPAAPAAAEPTAEPTIQDPGTTPTALGTVPSPTPSPTPTATLKPADVVPEVDPDWLAMLYRDQGSAIARIQIPAIDVDKTVVEGVRVSDLRKGPGHYPTTPMPGQAGNAAIAGHRTTYGAPFGELDKLEPGDQIIVTTIQGQFTYEVAAQGQGHGHFIVAPHQVEVLDQDFSDHPNRLTLTACHPKRSARQRIIVVAALVGDPAPTYPRPGQKELTIPELATEGLDETTDAEQAVTATPAPQPPKEAVPSPAPTELVESSTPVTAPTEAAPSPTPVSDEPSFIESSPDPTPAPEAEEDEEEAAAGSFGEGLDGDSDGLVPAILWGLAALAIWFFALFVGQRWRRLPAYALSALPFLVVLFMAFWHIDRVLPSY